MSKKKVVEQDDVEMTFGEHLEELRKVLIHIAIAFLVLFVILFIFFKGDILNLVFYPAQSDFISNRLMAKLASLTGIDTLRINAVDPQIYNTKMAGQFMLHIKVSAVGALIVGFPYIIGQLWSFIKPALTKEIKRRSISVVLKIVLWFFVGVSFSYFVIAPLGINFLITYEANGQIDNIIDVSSYVGTVLGVCFAGGLVFQLPLLIRLLATVGIVNSAWLKQNRKYAIVVLLITSALITPPDVMSQLLIFLPFYLLYEYGITIAKRIEKSEELRVESS